LRYGTLMTTRDAESYGAFEATRWSLVDRAAGADSEVRREALNQLLKRYLPALRAHLVLRKRIDATAAEDLLQSFVVEKILERDLLQCVDAAKGKFRTFLLTSLENYVTSAGRKQHARKRAHEALAGEGTVERIENPPCDVFEVAWAQQVFSSALAQMRQECCQTGRSQIWKLFERRIVAPLIEGTAPADYGALLAEFGFSSPEQAANALVTAKRHFKRVVTSIVGEYEQQSLDMEMAWLCEVLGQPGALHLPALVDSGVSMVNESDGLASYLPNGGCAGLATVISQNLDSQLWNADDLGPILRHQLDMPLQVLLSGDPSAWAKLSELRHKVEPPIKNVRELIRHARPPLELLRAVKHWSKRHIASQDQTLPGEVALVLYLTTIAVAWRRHGKLITSTKQAQVKNRLATILNHAWLADDVREEISKALELMGR
jgi:DNA-directed RNA polymerase specialized sigma24 family protein